MRELLPSREVCKRVLRTPSARPVMFVFVAGTRHMHVYMPCPKQNAVAQMNKCTQNMYSRIQYVHG
jgi:hypothetical protein